jgi:hypothetical protein
MEIDEQRKRFFNEDDAPLPLHLFLIREMSMPQWANRFTTSVAARSSTYECFSFYKHISRVLPCDFEEDNS